MLENYNINDYLKDDKELQKAVIQELLDDFQCAVMNVENLLETKQRLKAELTELGKIIDSKNGTIATLAKTRDELKADNEKLKALCDTYRTCYQAKHSDIKGLLLKYKQTLQEIKAIVKNVCNGCTSECDCDEDCNYFLITEALTKAGEE